MINNLKEIAVLRKKFGLTQTELSKLAGVSQSLIAKIEAGNIDPTYSNTQKIFSALEGLSKKTEIKADKLMKKNIVSVKENDLIRFAILKMKKYGISQMPVIDDNKAHGMVSDHLLLESIITNPDKEVKVKDIMAENPPTVSKSANIHIISNLLKYYPMVLVAEKGKLLGVITKADLLEKMY